MDSEYPIRDKIFIELTNICNFNCPCCPSSKMKRNRGFMDDALFYSLVDQISEYGLSSCVAFHVMGEPLLHPSFPLFLHYAKTKIPTVHLFTNGSRITPDLLNLILSHADILDINLQSCDERSFERRQAKDISFAQYADKIKAVIEAKFRAGSNCRIQLGFIDGSLNMLKHIDNKSGFPINRRAIERHVHESWEPFFLSIADKYKVPFSFLAEHITVHVQHQVLPGVTVYTRWATTWGNSVCTSPNIIPALYAKCNGLTDQLAILWNGDVTPCCNDFDGSVVLGNAHSTSLVDIMDSDLFRQILNGFQRGIPVHPHCQKCKGGPSVISWLCGQLFSFVRYNYVHG